MNTRIAAPPFVVFRFYTLLDHLRFISSPNRHEWCPEVGVVLKLGQETEVCIQQGRHRLSLRFRVVRLEQDRFVEDEFLTWPTRGARHRQIMEPLDNGRETQMLEAYEWAPPWWLHHIVRRHVDEQRVLFERRHENARRLIEAAYERCGVEAFSRGVFHDATLLGISPVVLEPPPFDTPPSDA